MIIELGLASEATKGKPVGAVSEFSQATGLPCNAPPTFDITVVIVPGCRI